MSYRTLQPGQTAQIHVYDTQARTSTLLYEDEQVLLEAPNWSGDQLILNGEGVLWSLPVSPGSRPRKIDHQDLPAINNDHVLDPQGKMIFLSAMDGHIYRADLTGGPVDRITSEEGIWHFLHGVSPDGGQLAFVRMQDFGQPGALALIPVGGGQVTIMDTGNGHIDGPEWSPDGSWIYFNTERWATQPGHAQLARIPDGGGEVERLLESATVDWFPHLSPDGRLAVYLEFPTGTQGHPADHDVSLVFVSTDDWTTPLDRVQLPGGQGTINVNNWAPDSQRFAYVSYPTR